MLPVLHFVFLAASRNLASGGGDPVLEKQFLVGSEKLKMQQLAGHRSVGGIRASIYNALELADVERLTAYMKEFMAASMP